MRITTTTLQEIFQVDAATAKKALAIIKNKVSDDDLQEHTQVRQCYHYDRHYAKMLNLNTLLNCYGVEAIGVTMHGAYCEYLNVGDSYATTLLYLEHRRNPWVLGCWADVAESREYQKEFGDLSE